MLKLICNVKHSLQYLKYSFKCLLKGVKCECVSSIGNAVLCSENDYAHLARVLYIYIYYIYRIGDVIVVLFIGH